VPSRLKGPKARGNRLSGWRVAVKDIFTIQGLKTSVCNRAYYELYPPALYTAGCIKLLQDEGAYVLGTTKLASFAATEEPIECVDYQAPWNPRADGHQSPAGSSSGSGVAIASYPWLDISIGSDSKLHYLLDFVPYYS
jgi:Asp-tRNA(Asn)/Glu-tRNA(Gln) amidotransferase A subunit family amidase